MAFPSQDNTSTVWWWYMRENGIFNNVHDFFRIFSFSLFCLNYLCIFWYTLLWFSLSRPWSPFLWASCSPVSAPLCLHTTHITLPSLAYPSCIVSSLSLVLKSPMPGNVHWGTVGAVMALGMLLVGLQTYGFLVCWRSMLTQVRVRNTAGMPDCYQTVRNWYCWGRPSLGQAICPQCMKFCCAFLSCAALR